MEQKIKAGLLVFISIVLTVPLIQHLWPFIDSGRLKGAYTNAPDISINFKNWFDGSFQEKKGRYNNDHIGFRPDMLRLAGQIDYSFFQKIDYGAITIGKDHYLFFDDYLDGYYGNDFAGYRVLKERMIKLKAIQDTLSRLGKTVVLIYAPCKAWYCKEYLPERFWKFGNPANDNYKISEQIGDSLDIHQLDFNAWFLAMKDTTHELLFSRLGIHWTNYASILGADSMIRYIDHVRNIHMPYPTWDKVLHTTKAKVPDNDMADIANLIFPMSVDTFCYPELKYVKDKTTTEPKIIYIGDSFLLTFLQNGLMQNISANWQFWYYFKNVFNPATWASGSNVSIPVKDYDWKKELNNADCIIIMNTAKNCLNISDGFIEMAYDYYYPGKKG